MNPNEPSDAEEDPDEDHLVNREEYELGLSINGSNEVTLVFFNPDPGAAKRSPGGNDKHIFLTRENLEAKAVATVRQKEGYPEFTDENYPPSDPPKYYLSQEKFYEGEGDGYEVIYNENMTHSASRYCLKEFDPNGWPSAPSNHICTGEESYSDSWWFDDHWHGDVFAYTYAQPNEALLVTGTRYENGSSGPYYFYVNTCEMPFDDELEIYSHTTAYISNAWDHYLEMWAVPDPLAYEIEYITLTNEYTTDMLRAYTTNDLPPLLNWSGLDWGERWARINHYDQPHVEALPTNEIYSACLLSDDHAELFVQELQYRWTIPTEAGVNYKLMWLEAFRPQNSDTYADFALNSKVFTGTGSEFQSELYSADRPWVLNKYGTVSPTGFLVEMITPAGDPVNSPIDAGDGQNEFAFSTNSPGILTMSLKAQVIPGGMANQIADMSYFTVDAISGSTMEWATANPDGKSTASGDYLMATVTFTGLPSDNSIFGSKMAAVNCDNCKQDENAYEIFFPYTSSNHPGNHMNSPNWFYYWNQTLAGDSRCTYAEELPLATGNARTTLGVYDPDTDTPFIGPGAGAFGIDMFAKTVKHELRHQQDYNNTHGVMAQSDWDGDWIADNLETDQNWDQGKTAGGLTDLAIELWNDSNTNGLVDIGEDEGLLAYVHKAGELPTLGVTLKDNLQIDQESMSGTTSPYSINSYKNNSQSYAAEDIVEVWDIEWWARWAEQQWILGSADALDWSDVGENHGGN